MKAPAPNAYQDALPEATIVHDYSIQQVLGHGRVGIVYLARHLERGNLAAIKEYMPRASAIRDESQVCPRDTSCLLQYQEGLRRFADDAMALIEISGHPNIAMYRDSYQHNGTAYLVMDFVDGLPLSQLLLERERQGRPFGEEDLMSLAIPLTKGLGSLHRAGLIHRNIKPENILLCETTGQPVIIGFRQDNYNMSTYTEPIERTSSGYTAWEQYAAAGCSGPWTDIYAVGALLWRIVAGGNPNLTDPTPVSVVNRAHASIRAMSDPMPSATGLGDGRFHPRLLAAIDACLELNHDRRVQTCAELLDLLRVDTQFQFEIATKYLRRATESPDPTELQRESHPEDIRPKKPTSSDSVKWYLLSEDGSEQVFQNHQILSEAARWMSLAAKNGNTVAQNELAFMLFYGLGTPRNVSAAVSWWEKAAESQYAEAEYLLGIIYANSHLYAKFGETSESTVLDSLNNPKVYRIPQDCEEFKVDEISLVEKATKWLCRAAEHGHAHAQQALEVYGVSNAFGNSSQHIVSAPLPECQYEIGKLYHQGEEVPRNYNKAIKWYRIAADHRHDHYRSEITVATLRARQQLTRLSKQYLALPQVNERLETEANTGCVDSQCNLGWLYSTGNHVKLNYGSTVKWYRLAAQQGSIRAQNNLGVCYMYGNGVPRDYRRAIEWFRLAARLESDFASDRFSSETSVPMQGCWEDEDAERCFRLSLRASLRAYRDETACLEENGDAAQALYNLALVLIQHSRESKGEYIDGLHLHIADQDSEALQYMREAAVRGDPNAQYNIGVSLEHSEEAVGWFRRSAAQGHTGSIQALAATDQPVHSRWLVNRLRAMIEDSLQDQGTSHNNADLHRQAIEWYTSGGMHRTRAIGLRLDFLYDMGSREILDVYLDSDYEGRDYAYKCAEEGEAYSQFECGIVAQFDHGFITEHEWLCGNPHDRDFQKLITGFGTDVASYPAVVIGDYCDAFQDEDALQWFEKAAQSENSLSDPDENRESNLGAINNLGIYRVFGSDDGRDYSIAFDLFLKAATLGHTGAQFNLGVCYARGIGTDIDSASAFDWFWKAAHGQDGQIWHERSSSVGYCRVIGNSISDWEYVGSDAAYDPFCDGLIDAQYNLGISFLQGAGTERNVSRSISWLSVAGSHGDRRALADLGWTSSSLLDSIFESYDEEHPYPPPSTARESIVTYRTHAVHNRCLCSQAFMGWMYSLGLGTERDAIEAFRWFSLARSNSEDSNDVASYYLGSWGATRSGTSSILEKGAIDTRHTSSPDSVPWSLKFASPDAEMQKGQSQVDSSPFAICRQWASLGDPDAQYFFGWMCAVGHGTEMCASEAEEWYRRAAKQGHVSAAHQLGLMYDEGQGVAQDPERAAAWYRRCARHDRADAQYRLGRLHETGRGGELNLASAVELYREAAEHGHRLARFRLGLAYETGAGVQQDSNMALRYYLDAYDSERTGAQLELNVQAAGFRLTSWRLDREK